MRSPRSCSLLLVLCITLGQADFSDQVTSTNFPLETPLNFRHFPSPSAVPQGVRLQVGERQKRGGLRRRGIQRSAHSPPPRDTGILHCKSKFAAQETRQITRTQNLKKLNQRWFFYQICRGVDFFAFCYEVLFFPNLGCVNFLWISDSSDVWRQLRPPPREGGLQERGAAQPAEDLHEELRSAGDEKYSRKLLLFPAKMYTDCMEGQVTQNNFIVAEKNIPHRRRPLLEVVRIVVKWSF